MVVPPGHFRHVRDVNGQQHDPEMQCGRGGAAVGSDRMIAKSFSSTGMLVLFMEAPARTRTLDGRVPVHVLYRKGSLIVRSRHVSSTSCTALQTDRMPFAQDDLLHP